MINEKCCECVHCEVCAFIESETAKAEACDFYTEGCEDAISREAVQDLIATWLSDYLTDETREVLETIDYKISDMPTVYPKQKTGHWIYSKAVNTGEIVFSECSACGHGESRCARRMNYCPNCGARMEESEE